jgi:hypothetical protein
MKKGGRCRRRGGTCNGETPAQFVSLFTAGGNARSRARLRHQESRRIRSKNPVPGDGVSRERETRYRLTFHRPEYSRSMLQARLHMSPALATNFEIAMHAATERVPPACSPHNARLSVKMVYGRGSPLRRRPTFDDVLAAQLRVQLLDLLARVADADVAIERRCAAW